MERIYQMNVVPNVLPILKPSLDLHVVARTRPSEFLKTGKVQSEVEPGVFLRPKQVNSSFLVQYLSRAYMGNFLDHPSS